MTSFEEVDGDLTTTRRERRRRSQISKERGEEEEDELVGDLDLVPTAFQQSNSELLVDLVVLGEQDVEKNVLGLQRRRMRLVSGDAESKRKEGRERT